MEMPLFFFFLLLAAAAAFFFLSVLDLLLGGGGVVNGFSFCSSYVLSRLVLVLSFSLAFFLRPGGCFVVST